MTKLEDWNRLYFKESLDSACLFFVVYGNFDVNFQLSKEKYRTNGIPDGIELMKYGPEKHPEVLKGFLKGYVWEQLKRTDPLTYDQIEKAPQCFIFNGQIKDTESLNYYRDVIGIIAYLLDNGGIAVYDPQMFAFWKKSDWVERVFKPNAPVPRHHVLIIYSDDDNGTKWYHTRGLRKYGRPDLSIHNVPSDKESAVIDLLNRFIEFQAFGGIIKDGQKINIEKLPQGMWCENKGDFDDPDFNNKHVEIRWK